MVNTKLQVWLKGELDVDRFDRADTLEVFIEQLKALKGGDTVSLWANTNREVDKNSLSGTSLLEYNNVLNFVVQPEDSMFEKLYRAVVTEASPFLTPEQHALVNAKLDIILAEHDCAPMVPDFEESVNQDVMGGLVSNSKII